MSKFHAALTIAVLSGTGVAQGATVWTEDFSDDTVGSAPKQNYVITAGNDWSVGTGTGISQTVTNTTGSLAYSGSDTSTSISSSSFVNFSRFGSFDTSLPSQKTFTATFDFRVDSFVCSNISTFRVTLQDQYQLAGVNRARTMTIGLGYANIDGVTGNELFLKALAKDDALSSASTIESSAASAIGWDGTSFASGFNFGQYDSANAAANDTNDEFYRFSLTFTGGSGVVDGAVTRLSDSSSVAFTRSLPQGSEFEFKGGALAGATPTDAMGIVLPQGGTGQIYVDNMSFTAVPEPTSLGLIGVAACGLLARRRR
ncbi:MAG TPA: PEP-CTERM sorting domain-containing protein [Tepidisphaeraceae bacterium]|nr:PEP-CTERM sorting domain-containing protein [Tepidisphaeraceae bacterium]